MVYGTYTNGNKDDIQHAAKCLNEFTHNFCMDCKATDEQKDLFFRCGECPFCFDEICKVKEFKNKFAPHYKNFGSMGDS